jgi:hypothetical protein
VAWAALGSQAPWAVLAVVLLGIVLRAADVEARAILETPAKVSPE